MVQRSRRSHTRTTLHRGVSLALQDVVHYFRPPVFSGCVCQRQLSLPNRWRARAAALRSLAERYVFDRRGQGQCIANALIMYSLVSRMFFLSREANVNAGLRQESHRLLGSFEKQRSRHFQVKQQKSDCRVRGVQARQQQTGAKRQWCAHQNTPCPPLGHVSARPKTVCVFSTGAR